MQHNWQSHQQLPPPKQSQKCPRCDSANTKFGYYNNYSITQPRYFCRACRRYWTHGGTLRNIPVGGGSRKGKRGKSSESDNSRFHPLKMDKAMAIPQMSSSYSGSGFLYTLANIQSQRQNLSPYNTPPTSNSAIFQNRARASPSCGLLHAKSGPDSQFVNRNESGTEYYPLNPAGPDLTIPNSKSTPFGSWNQTPIANNSTASIDQTFWSSDLAS